MKTLEKTGCRLLRTTSVLSTCKRPWVSRPLEEGDKILPGHCPETLCLCCSLQGSLSHPPALRWSWRTCIPVVLWEDPSVASRLPVALWGGGSFPRTPGTSLPEIKAQFSGPHRLQLLVSCPHGLLHPHTTDGEAGSEKGRGVQGHPKSGTELDWNLAGHTLKQRSFASTQLGRHGDSRVAGGGGCRLQR